MKKIYPPVIYSHDLPPNGLINSKTRKENKMRHYKNYNEHSMYDKSGLKGEENKVGNALRRVAIKDQTDSKSRMGHIRNSSLHGTQISGNLNRNIFSSKKLLNVACVNSFQKPSEYIEPLFRETPFFPQTSSQSTQNKKRRLCLSLT